jgi:hypothetical protein
MEPIAEPTSNYNNPTGRHWAAGLRGRGHERAGALEGAGRSTAGSYRSWLSLRSTEVVTNTPPHDCWNRPYVIREVIDQGLGADTIGDFTDSDYALRRLGPGNVRVGPGRGRTSQGHEHSMKHAGPTWTHSRCLHRASSAVTTSNHATARLRPPGWATRARLRVVVCPE